MSYLNKTISEFLKELSARTPVPGGGSAAALSGALGMGLLAMSARYSFGKKRPKDKKIGKILRESARLQSRFSQLIEEDVQNYTQVVRAQRLVKYLPERRQRPFMEPSLRKALASALDICKNAYHGTHLSKMLLEKGNPYLVSDVATGIALLSASFFSARFLCEANLAALRNRPLLSRTDRLLSFQESEIRQLMRQLPGKVRRQRRMERRHVR